MSTQFEPVVGMEIHVELKTASKMFCGCVNDPFHAEKPNIYTCPVCLAIPGGLPVPNKKAIQWIIKLGLALHSDIQLFSKFDRKHYFYPDLPKGYQISQYEQPFCLNGIVSIPEGDVRIHRIHLEEDTGKLLHTMVNEESATLIDFNRGGVPLVEIVTEPDIHSGEQAKAFLKKLHRIIRYLDISDADMEKGSMRLEPNISIRPIGTSGLPNYKVEVKNINSFNFVKRAIDFEAVRQQEILETGAIPPQETRGWNAEKNCTVSQRVKENADDYRYFPEPDIPPIRITEEEIADIRSQLPELPDEKAERFSKQYGLKQTEIDLLIESKAKADFFETAVALLESNKEFTKLTPTVIAKAMINQSHDESSISPLELLTELNKKIANNSLDESFIRTACEKIIMEHEEAVKSYTNGKESALMFLVGQVKKELQGKGDAEIIKKQLISFIVPGS
jgi:aspartyl-tRNA(Asn)/glutamyl-tRNA(Gln) amidotransferase subunit B